MWLKTIISIKIFLVVNQLMSQQIFKFEGKILDSENNAVPSVHIKLSHDFHGTITNEDGFFKISSDLCYPEIIISHLQFKTETIKLNCKKPFNNIIKLETEIITLNEIVLNGITVTEIMKHCIQNFEKNHDDSKAIYTLFDRTVEYIDKQPIFVIEFLFDMIFKKAKKADFYLEKYRQKKFIKEQTDDIRLIEIHRNENHLIRRYPASYLKKVRKNVNYKWLGTIDRDNKKFYVINIQSNGYHKNVILHIDTETYGIGYKKIDYLDESFGKHQVKNSSIESIYKKDGKIWYFSYGKIVQTHCQEGNCSQIEKWTTVLDRNLYKEPHQKNELGNMAQKLSKFETKFEDKYWETNNIIPLPDWLSTK